MRFDAEVDGRRVAVTVRGEAGRYEVSIGEDRRVLDARPTAAHAWSILVDGKSYDVGLEKSTDGVVVHFGGRALGVRLEGAHLNASSPAAGGAAALVAPMPGKVVRVLVALGDPVERGAGLVVVEAMKMENELRATRAGRVRRLHVREGQLVEGGALLLELE